MTFNFSKVISDIEAFCDNNAMVSKFYYQGAYSMEGSTEADYPAVIVERSTSLIAGGEKVFSLQITCVDQPKENEDDMVNIHSKTFEILADLAANFNMGEGANYTLVGDVNPEPITHENNDRIEGWSAIFDFSIASDNGCIYPEND